MAKFTEEFAPTEVSDVSLQFNGDEQAVLNFPCVGSLSGETVLKELVRLCGGSEVGKKVKPEKTDLTLSGHVPIEAFRKIYGLKNEGLKAGVYRYNTKSMGSEFTLTANVIDDFGDHVKLIAFPRVNSTSGLNFTVTNGQDEVAEVELTLSAYPDGPENDIYYEAFVDDVTDEEVKTSWHTAFNYELVEAVAP